MGTHRRRVCHEANSSRLSLSLSLLCSSSLVPRCRRSFPASAFFPSLDTRHTCQHSLNTRATCLSLNGPRNLYFAEAYARLVKRGLLTRRNRLPAVFHSPLPLSASFFPLLFFLLPLIVSPRRSNSKPVNDFANISPRIDRRNFGKFSRKPRNCWRNNRIVPNEQKLSHVCASLSFSTPFLFPVLPYCVLPFSCNSHLVMSQRWFDNAS